ncbi:MAG: DUF2202 domain-containing protein [Epsilonproteobacteria bacterium]|nr:DUF2202 domain-containing protein [Campylobacterota bacterium]
MRHGYFKGHHHESEVSYTLTNEEIESLIHMREEEKLARDVYLTLADKYSDTKVFSNIANAEQHHMDKIGELLDKYGIEDPVKSDEVGVFSDESMSALYTQLTTQGLNSLSDALTVGATIEDLDIFDLEDEIGDSSNPDIVRVYSQLEHGSEHHLNAFTYNLEILGEDYTPQYISTQDYQDIIGM